MNSTVLSTVSWGELTVQITFFNGYNHQILRVWGGKVLKIQAVNGRNLNATLKNKGWIVTVAFKNYGNGLAK